MRRRIGIIGIMLCAAVGMYAGEGTKAGEGGEAERREAGQGFERTNVLKVKAGGSYLLDTYLSPLAYRGWQVGLSNEWWQPFRHAEHWAHVGRVEVNGFRTLNSARTNRISGIAIHGGWGALYGWRWCDERLKVWVGPYLEAGLTARYISTNVNKPLSLDLSAEVMAMGGIAWSFYGRKTSYRLYYQVRTNIVGIDHMPDYWQSYYELTEGVRGVIRCSGHWNHHTVKHELGMDMQLPHTTWRVGVGHDYTSYSSENLQFVRSTIELIIGCLWNYHIQSNNRL